MQTELNIHGEDYTQIIYVICKCPERSKNNSNGWLHWLHHHTYTDLGKAKAGLKKLLKDNPYNYSYKIRKFVIKGIDLITNKAFPLIENRDTCDCFHCGKMIQAGDELVFGGDLGEVYCSHECVSLNRDNEYWTALNNPDEYLPWFPENGDITDD